MTAIDQARQAIRWCRQLATLSEDRGATTRRCLSKPMRDVHTALATWMARCGMTVRVDAAGNIRGLLPRGREDTPRRHEDTKTGRREDTPRRHEDTKTGRREDTPRRHEDTKTGRQEDTPRRHEDTKTGRQEDIPRRHEGTKEGDAPPRLYIGSHLDTVPNAGAFDGVLGVVMGVALVELLGSRRLPFAIEVVGFSDEEGVRFGEPFLGSRALAGTFDAALLDRRDETGRTVRDAIRNFGLEPSRIPDAKAAPDALGYLEFHIEQGPVLENLGLPVAVVEAISGQSRAELTFTGSASHAGTTPMQMRQDALSCAAEWMAEVERDAMAAPGLVATVGKIAVEPNAGNVVPGRAILSLDVRHPADATRKAAYERMTLAADTIATRRGLRMTCEPRLDQPSVPMDASIALTLERAIERTRRRAHRMPSGAGHDAMVMAATMPAGMLFLRCERGISHHPAENVREDDVAAALEVGLTFLDSLMPGGRG